MSHTRSLGHFTAHVLLVPTADNLGIAVLANANAIIAAGHHGQYDLGLGLVRILLSEQPQPAHHGFALTLAPAAAWTAGALVLTLVVRPLIRRGRSPQRTVRRTRRRAALVVALLVAGVTLLAVPLATARHFYPDTG